MTPLPSPPTHPPPHFSLFLSVFSDEDRVVGKKGTGKCVKKGGKGSGWWWTGNYEESKKANGKREREKERGKLIQNKVLFTFISREWYGLTPFTIGF